MSALYKIPILALLSLTVPVIGRSPNPPTEGREQARFSSIHTDAGMQVQRVSTKWLPIVYKGFIWSLYAVEIAAIALSARPQLVQHLGAIGIPYPSAHSTRFTPAFIGGAILMIVGVVLRVYAMRTLGKYYTFELSIRDDHKLVTTGPYSVVRHPGYTAVFLYTPGIVLTQMCAGSWWTEAGLWETAAGRAVGYSWLAFLTLTSGVMIHRVVQEDKALREVFKDQWIKWSKRTPYRLIPLVY